MRKNFRLIIIVVASLIAGFFIKSIRYGIDIPGHSEKLRVLLYFLYCLMVLITAHQFVFTDKGIEKKQKTVIGIIRMLLVSFLVIPLATLLILVTVITFWYESAVSNAVLYGENLQTFLEQLVLASWVINGVYHLIQIPAKSKWERVSQ